MFLMFDFEHFPSNKFTAIEIITETTDNFLHGMATQQGLKIIEQYKQERKINEHEHEKDVGCKLCNYAHGVCKQGYFANKKWI